MGSEPPDAWAEQSGREAGHDGVEDVAPSEQLEGEPDGEETEDSDGNRGQGAAKDSSGERPEHGKERVADRDDAALGAEPVAPPDSVPDRGRSVQTTT